MPDIAEDMGSAFPLRSALTDPFEHFPIGVYRTAPDGTVLYANQGKDDRVFRINSHFTKLFEYTPEDAAGRKIEDLIVPHEFAEEAADISSRVSAGQTVEAQLLRRTKSGRLIPVSLLGTPFTG